MNNFDFEYLSLKQLGTLFGRTSHEIGAILKQLNLRQADGLPYEHVLSSGLAKRLSETWYSWHQTKVVQILEQNGFKRLDDQNIVGNFSVERDSSGQLVLVGSKGNGFCVVKGERNADGILELLNSAHKAGWFTDEWWSKRKEPGDEQ